MILITGASSGIGEACARAYAATGRSLFLLARRGERLGKLAEELKRKHGTEIVFREVDVRSRERVARLAIEDAALLERVEVLINNAGLARGIELLHQGDPADWDEMIDTNVKGTLYVTKAVLPFMLGKNRGHVVNLGSVAGHWNYKGGNVYCATKHAVRALTESLRLDLNGTPIRVTEISPGMVETEFSEVRLRDKDKAEAVYQGMTPLRPEDIAETVLWATQRPAHVNIQEIVIYPTDQASVSVVHRGSRP